MKEVSRSHEYVDLLSTVPEIGQLDNVQKVRYPIPRNVKK
jgi:hypothetical protein